MATAVAAADDLEARISGLVAEVVAPRAAAMARGEGDGGRSLIAEAGRRGLCGLLVPIELGGAGISHAAFARLIEAVAKVCASSAVILDVQGSVASEPIVVLGSPEQRQRFLPRLAAGEWVGAFALSEPGSGSDAASLTTRAERIPGGWRLTGTKMWISNAGVADLYTVMARTGGAGARGISAFVVEASRPGVRPGRPLHKLGLRGSWTAELHLDGVEVPESNLLAAEGQGFRVAMTALDSGRVGISAQAVGIAQGALDAAIVHLRTQGATAPAAPPPLFEVDALAAPAWMARLADMAAAVESARALTLHAAAVCDAGEPVTRDAAVAKLVATDAAVAVAHSAVELCAPASSAEHHPASLRLRDAKACQIYEGTNQIQRVVIARELLRD